MEILRIREERICGTLRATILPVMGKIIALQKRSRFILVDGKWKIIVEIYRLI